MTALDAADKPYLKPLPEVTDYNRLFFDALKAHRFVIPRCQECGDYNWIPYPACRTCLSDRLEWTEVSGDATLYTYTVIHRAAGAFAADVPYVVAMGELVEQPRPCLVLANLVGTSGDDLQIGQRLQIAYEDIPSEDITVYNWVVKPD